jgi:hypothetical protein
VSASVLLRTAGALLALAALAGPVASHGPGSTLTGWALVSLTVSGGLDAWIPWWAGIVLAAVPLGGGLVLLGTGLGDRAEGPLVAAGVGLAAAGVACTAAALGGAPLVRPGAGGLALWLAAAAWAGAEVARRPRPSLRR